MIMLGGALFALFVAWRVRLLGVYIALCDTLGVLLGGAAALAYTRIVAEMIPFSHPLKGAGCMAGLFLVVWMVFRSLARSFAGDVAIDFDKRVEFVAAALVAFLGTFMFVGFASVIVLVAGNLPPSAAVLDEPLRQAAGVGISAARFVMFFAGGDVPITLETVLAQAQAAT